MLLALIRGLVSLGGDSGQGNSGASSSVRATVVYEATTSARQAASARTPTPASSIPTKAQTPVGSLAHGCSGWDEWVSQVRANANLARTVIATAKAVPYPTSNDYVHWENDLNAIASEVEASSHPKAADAYVDNLVAYYHVLASAYHGTANQTAATIAWDRVNSYRVESDRLWQEVYAACHDAPGPPTAMPTPTRAPTRTPIPSPTSVSAASCYGWNGWVDRMEALQPAVERVMATASADRYPTTNDYSQWTSDLLTLAGETRGTNPPPAASAYVDAVAGQLLALRRGLLIAESGGNSQPYFNQAQRRYDEAERLRIAANLACAG